MKTLGIVFARSDSSRFPQKAMQDFLGLPLVVYVLKRASLSKKLQKVVLATSSRTEDDMLANLVEQQGFSVFRGDFKDVAKRAADCVQLFGADAFVRLNGDSPAIDVALLDQGITKFEEQNADFLTNLTPKRTYPYGVAVEIIRTDFFVNLCKKQRTDEEKEHLTKMLYEKYDSFNLVEMPACEYSCSNASLTIDTFEDYIRLSNIYNNIVANNSLNYQYIYSNLA